jgi:hypothetical protein
VARAVARRASRAPNQYGAERDRLERRAREAAAEWKAWNDREQAAGRASPELEAALALAAETVR